MKIPFLEDARRRQRFRADRPPRSRCCPSRGRARATASLRPAARRRCGRCAADRARSPSTTSPCATSTPMVSPPRSAATGRGAWRAGRSMPVSGAAARCAFAPRSARCRRDAAPTAGGSSWSSARSPRSRRRPRSRPRVDPFDGFTILAGVPQLRRSGRTRGMGAGSGVGRGACAITRASSPPVPTWTSSRGSGAGATGHAHLRARGRGPRRWPAAAGPWRWRRGACSREDRAPCR